MTSRDIDDDLFDPDALKVGLGRLQRCWEAGGSLSVGIHYDEAEALLVERDMLYRALEHLASPNYSAKPTAQDARDMAAFARRTLDELRPES